MTAIIILALAFGALGIYYGCRQGFKAWQWEHRHGEVSKQLAEVLKNNGDWAVWYEALNNNYRDALRELSLLRAGEIADSVRILELEALDGTKTPIMARGSGDTDLAQLLMRSAKMDCWYCEGQGHYMGNPCDCHEEFLLDAGDTEGGSHD